MKKLNIKKITEKQLNEIKQILKKEGATSKLIVLSKIIQLMANQIPEQEFPINLLPYRSSFFKYYPNINHFFTIFFKYSALSYRFIFKSIK